MRPQNLVFIMSDEHNREITGCYGGQVSTPHLDALAERGTRFSNAYTNCPICVPARASFATGRYVHQIGCWDNAHGYYGDPPGWGHRLIEARHEVTAIGKLHYRSEADPTGWTEEIDTLHIVDGLGDLFGLIREDMRERESVELLAREAGPGDSSYIRYDARIADAACNWLDARSAAPSDRPWVLYVGFVLPHFPLIAPPEFFAMYPPDDLPPPRLVKESERPRHPVLETMRRVMAYDDYFDEETVKIARAAYYGMVSYLDHNVGRVLTALEHGGLSENTRVIYTSDHGDNLGHRGFWGKSVMYEESTAVPLLMAGADVPQGVECTTPVSLVDCYPTILEGAGLAPNEVEPAKLPGRSLFAIAGGETPERAILSEYHALGSSTGMFMIRHDRWKYVYYVGHPPQLFDLEEDPFESRDLAHDPAYAKVCMECEGQLRAIVDPEDANARAFADQARMIEENGGVESILKRGEFSHTPAPGESAHFASNNGSS